MELMQKALLENLKDEMEKGNITRDDVMAIIPKCKKCIMSGIISFATLIGIGIIIGMLI
jgi:hypothetical protein